MQDRQTFETIASQNYGNNVKDNKIWIVFLCLTTFSSGKVDKVIDLLPRNHSNCDAPGVTIIYMGLFTIGISAISLQ